MYDGGLTTDALPHSPPPFTIVVSVAHRSSGGGDDKRGQHAWTVARIRLIVGATMSKAAPPAAAASRHYR